MGMNGSNILTQLELRVLLDKYVKELLCHYQVIIENNPDAFLVIDREGYLSFLNPACEKMIGFSLDEPWTVTYNQILTTDAWGKANRYFQQSLEGKVGNFDSSFLSKEGQRIEVNITKLPISVQNEIIGVVVIANDITQLKLNKKSYRDAQQVYNFLAHNSLDLITKTDLKAKLKFVSASSLHITGYSHEELIGKSFFELVHRDDRDLAKQNYFNLLNSGFKRDTFRIQKKEGTYIWMDVEFVPIIDDDTEQLKEIISVARDITELKKAENAISESEQRYRNLVEYSPDAVVIIRNGLILYINDTGVELFQVESRDVMIGKDYFELLEPEKNNMLEKKMAKKHLAIDFMEQRLILPNGNLLEVEVKGIPTIYQNESAIHLIIRDISERKKTQELMINSEKLSVAGKLAAGIAHEVRNPLTAIKGFIQLIEHKYQEDHTYFDIISSEINRIEIILNELLILAKPQKLKFEKCRLRVVLDHVVTLINTEAIMNNVEIDTQYEFKNLWINGDENQLKQVFINILKNAIEAMPKGGKITVEVKEFEYKKVKIQFIDCGIGIPKRLLDRIGEPFFTTKQGGTGLGLMISKEIIENHNGSFSIQSGENGTTVEIALPIL
ncbi:PAS domain S-box protein [Pseudoneobacillus sp. C159]